MKKISLNLIDRAVALVNPQAGVQRAIARAKLTHFDYDATKYNRERKGPSVLQGAESYRTGYDRIELMKRSRDLAENVGLVRSILMKFASHTAANVSYQARTSEPAVNTDVESFWAEWWDNCDISTRHTGSTLMQVAVMSMLRDGDFLFVLIRDRNGDLKLQGIEADRIGNPFQVYTSSELIGGIHIDQETGAPTAYDIFARSIGNAYTFQQKVSASQAFHLYDPLRIDQYRGISAFHTAINDAQDIYDIINFEKLSAKVASSQSAIVLRNNNNASDLSDLTADTNFDDQSIKLETMESGKISYLEPGETIQFPDGPNRPSGAFAEFHKILLRNICLGVGIPYSFAVDPSAMSGPTARLEMQQAGRTFRRYQKLLDDKILKPIKNIVIADAVARGLIENNAGTKTTRGIFNFGANVSIDLGRESASAISEFKTGLRTAADIYAERGQDFESAMRQRAIEAKLIKDLAGEYEVSADTISDIAMQGLQRESQVQTAQKPTDQPQGQDITTDTNETITQQDPAQPAEDLSTQSLNGAQVSSLITIINAVASGAVSKEGAVTIITSAFPFISQDQADSIMSGVNIGTIAPTTKTPPQPSPDQPTQTGGGNSLKKNELEELDCGTGSGGFQPGNSCAGEGDGGGAQDSEPKERYRDRIEGTDEEVKNEARKMERKLKNLKQKVVASKEREADIRKQISDLNQKITSKTSDYNTKIESINKAQQQIKQDGEVARAKIQQDLDKKLVAIADKYKKKAEAREEKYKKKREDRKARIAGIDSASFETKEDADNEDEIESQITDTENNTDKLKSLLDELKAILAEVENSEDKKKVLESLDPASIKMLIEGMMGGIELGKYDGIDFTPPEGARDAAKRALEVRETKPPSQRGMTPVGIARARDLQNGVKLSPDTIKRMKAFFDRHEVDKKGSTFGEQGKGWQAWNGWGGDAGYAWARKVVGQMEARDNKELARPVSQTPAPPKERIKGSKENPEGTASTRSKAGDIEISPENEEALKNKISEFKDKHPSRNAPSIGALKKVFRRGAGAFSTSFRPTITGGRPNSRNAWAMARVNKFLLMAGGGEVKKSYREADGDLL